VLAISPARSDALLRAKHKAIRNVRESQSRKRGRELSFIHGRDDIVWIAWTAAVGILIRAENRSLSYQRKSFCVQTHKT
jgi:hypothetical protein